MTELEPCMVYWGSSLPPISGGPASVVVSSNEASSICIFDEANGVSLWDVRDETAARPRGLANPVLGKVAVMFPCFMKQKECLALVYRDGSVAIVDIRDGTEYISSRSVAMHAQCGTMLKGTQYMVIGDTNCNLNFVNIETLKVATRIEVPSPGFPLALTSFKAGCCVTLAATHADKTLRFFRATNGKKLSITPDATTTVPLPPKKGTPVAISHHETLPLTLVLTVDSWLVFLDYCSTPLVKHTMDGLDTSVLSNGDFTNTDTGCSVVIVCSEGTVRTFTLPTAVGVYASEPTGPRPLHDLLPVLASSFNGSEHNAWGFGGSKLCGVSRESIKVLSMNLEGVTLRMDADPAAVWRNVMGTNTTTEAQHTVLKDSVLVCCSSDGTISADPVLGAVQPVSWKAHDTPITTLSSIDKFLISADVYGCVKAWEWGGDWRHIGTFYPHSSELASVLPATKSMETRHRIKFWTVGTDGNICFFTEDLETMLLPGNGPNPIGVYYIDSLDLVVVNADSTSQCDIWHLGTQTLTRSIQSPARETFLASLYDCENYIGTSPDSVSKRSTASYSIEAPKVGLSACVMNFRVATLVSQVHKISSGSEVSPDLCTLLTYLLCNESHPSVDGFRDALSLPTPLDKPWALGWARSKSPLTFLPAPALPSTGVYHYSPVATSCRLVTALSVLYPLCGKVACSKAAINYFGAALPKVIKSDPLAYGADFFWCLEAIKGPLKETQFSARCILGAIMRLKNPAELRELTERLKKMAEEGPKRASDMAYLGLAIMNWAGDSEMSKGACEGLIKVAIDGEPTWRVTALVLLADYFDVFGKWVPDLGELLKALLAQSCVGEGQQTDIVKHAFRAFIAASLHNVPLFLTFADSILSETAASKEEELFEENCILVAVSSMVRKSPVSFINSVHKIAALIAKAINPIYPKTRSKCMKSTTHALKTSIAAFPMMDFHQAKQTLAVGLPNGQTLMWDLRTCCKMWAWDAHSEPVSCVALSTMCDQIATYCSVEKAVKIWSTDVSIFNIFSSSTVPKLVHTQQTSLQHDLVQNSAAFLESCTIEWISPHAIELSIAKQTQQFHFK